MTIRDLLPVLPRYSDGSGYDFQINYCSQISIWEQKRRKGTEAKTSRYYENILIIDNSIFGGNKFYEVLESDYVGNRLKSVTVKWKTGMSPLIAHHLTYTVIMSLL